MILKLTVTNTNISYIIMQTYLVAPLNAVSFSKIQKRIVESINLHG
jgi:uncharacterized membrane protein